MTTDVLPEPVTKACRSRSTTRPGPGGSLSSSGARKLLPPSCPALFATSATTRRHQPTPSTSATPRTSSRSASARRSSSSTPTTGAPTRRRKRARRTRRQVPLLRDTYERAVRRWRRAARAPDRLRAARRRWPGRASACSGPTSRLASGAAAGSTGSPRHAGPMIGIDYKTARSPTRRSSPSPPSTTATTSSTPGTSTAWRARPRRRRRVRVHRPGEDRALPRQRRPARRRPPCDRPHLNRRAIDIYAECVRTGIWPGYATTSPRLAAVLVRAPFEGLDHDQHRDRHVDAPHAGCRSPRARRHDRPGHRRRAGPRRRRGPGRDRRRPAVPPHDPSPSQQMRESCAQKGLAERAFFRYSRGGGRSPARPCTSPASSPAAGATCSTASPSCAATTTRASRRCSPSPGTCRPTPAPPRRSSSSTAATPRRAQGAHRPARHLREQRQQRRPPAA
jgi:hypothetical protein